jgi:hypothetical protein
MIATDADLGWGIGGGRCPISFLLFWPEKVEIVRMAFSWSSPSAIPSGGLTTYSFLWLRRRSRIRPELVGFAA